MIFAKNSTFKGPSSPKREKSSKKRINKLRPSKNRLSLYKTNFRKQPQRSRNFKMRNNSMARFLGFLPRRDQWCTAGIRRFPTYLKTWIISQISWTRTRFRAPRLVYNQKVLSKAMPLMKNHWRFNSIQSLSFVPWSRLMSSNDRIGWLDCNDLIIH